MKKFSVFLCATMLVFGFAGMANASLINVISNGSFESPEVTMSPDGNAHWDLFESIDSWTHSGDWVELQENGLFPGFEAVNDGGDQWVELDAYAPYTLSQGFAAEPGKMYTVSFAYSARPNLPVGVEMGDLEFGVGGYTETIDVNTAGWQYYDYTFQATLNEYSITFTETGGTDGYGIFLDAVSVVDPPPPVPEPATMLLLGTGLIGLASLGRKRFFKK